MSRLRATRTSCGPGRPAAPVVRPDGREAVLAGLGQAAKSVDIAMYSFRDEGIKDRVETLARDGIPVRVLLDTSTMKPDRDTCILCIDLEAAVNTYSQQLGFKVSEPKERKHLGIKNVFMSLGDSLIELMEPLDHEQGPVSRFLKNRGEGIYLVELEVDDMDAAINELSDKGVRLIGADPELREKGGLVFIHPQSAAGVLMQLVAKEA